MSAQAANKAAKRNYAHQLKVRERKWMQTTSLYKTKKVQFEQEVDLANIAAQRAYSRTQQQLNNAQAMAILENQEDFKKMLQAEGQVEASAAERGVGGRSLARALVMNKGSYGVSQALRSRGLAMAGYAAKESNENVNRQLKSTLNRSFGRVAIQPVEDVAPPAPVLQNVGMTLMLGMGQALGAGIEGMGSNDAGNAYQSTTKSTSYKDVGTSLGYGADTSYTGMPSNPIGYSGYSRPSPSSNTFGSTPFLNNFAW